MNTEMEVSIISIKNQINSILEPPRRHNPPRLQATLQSYRNQKSAILAQKQTYKSMVQNRGPRIKPHTYGQLIFSTGGKSIYWEKFSAARGVRKCVQPHVNQ